MRSSVVSLLFLALLAGCSSDKAPEAPAAPAAAPADWCGGHGVPESMCTICNPERIPAFQAQGDWCAEHGLPESVCPACNPGAKAAAPAPAPADWCGGHGVPESMCTICNPERIPAFQAQGDWCAEHGLPESVCPKCKAAANEPPADRTPVRLRDAGVSSAVGIGTVPAEEAPAAGEVTAPARVVADPRATARITVPAEGVIRSVSTAPGERVAKGQVLARIDSAQVGADAASLQAARSRLEVAQADLDRATSLHAEGIVSRADLLQARRERDQAQADLAAARSALGVAGAGEDGPGYALRAPIAGTVIRQDAVVGRAVDHEEVLFEIVDPSRVTVEIDVAEADLPHVAVGAPVVLEIGGRTWTGSVASVAPALDPASRTAPARLVLPNPDGALRPGSWGTARIRVGAEAAAVVIPRGAVQQARGVPVAFVEIGPGLYETRHVRPAGRDGARVRLASGVAPGEKVVVEGAFLLKTETLRESIGAGCCE